MDDDEFPLLCDTCLGPNPFIRMMKDPQGAPCKVCERPFTSFHWRPGGKGMRPKKTETCIPCARMKNLCQTCQLDLKYNLPAKVRDQSLAPADRQLAVVPRSDGTREYTANQTVRDIASGAVDAVYNAPPANDVAERLQRKNPNYKRNTAKICTFFLDNRCKFGAYCQYRHERPDENRDKSLSEQNLRDRYYGTNDPVADKMLSRKRRLEPRQPWYEDRNPYDQGPPNAPDNRPAHPRSGAVGERGDIGLRGEIGDRPGTSRGRSGTDRPSTPRNGDIERPSTPRGGSSDMERPGTPRDSSDMERSATSRGAGHMKRPNSPRSGATIDRPSTPRLNQDDNRVGRLNGAGYEGSVPPITPRDSEIMELYIGGEAVSKKVALQEDIRDLFDGCFGLREVEMKKGFAFAMFSSRNAAEQAMEKCHGSHTIRGERLVVKWGNRSKKGIYSGDLHALKRSRLL